MTLHPAFHIVNRQEAFIDRLNMAPSGVRTYWTRNIRDSLGRLVRMNSDTLGLGSYPATILRFVLTVFLVWAAGLAFLYSTYLKDFEREIFRIALPE